MDTYIVEWIHASESNCQYIHLHAKTKCTQLREVITDGLKRRHKCKYNNPNRPQDAINTNRSTRQKLNRETIELTQTIEHPEV